MTADRPTIDAARVRALFSRARIAAADDFLSREVARRMTERLATIRVDARRILDAGCGSGADADALRARFDGATVVGVDLARPRLAGAVAGRRPGALARWFGRAADGFAVQADFAALPFAPRAFDVLWSNLALHWHSHPDRVLPEWSRVVRTGGLVVFSAFGPDTLREVAEASRGLGRGPHVVTFTDLHDYGDMLVASGFTAPVVDAERLTLTYATAAGLWSDVRALGGNPFAGATLGGRAARERLEAALDATRDAAGRYALTFELVYAHAWKAEPRTTRDGEAIVRVQRGGRRPAP